MKRWEYRIISVRARRGEEECGDQKEMLNELGEKGWEVCGYIPSDLVCYGVIILKREKD